MSSARFWLEQDMEKLQRQLAQQAAVITEQRETIERLVMESVRARAETDNLNIEQSELIEKLYDAMKFDCEPVMDSYAGTARHAGFKQALAAVSNWKENK